VRRPSGDAHGTPLLDEPSASELVPGPLYATFNWSHRRGADPALVPMIIPVAVVVPGVIAHRNRRGARGQRKHTECNGEREMFEIHDHLSTWFVAKTNSEGGGAVPNRRRRQLGKE
jgi:hypothetical protein